MLREDVKILSIAEVAEALDRADRVVEVPEWGGAVKLRAMTLEQRDVVIAQAKDDKGAMDGQKLVRLLVINGIVEPMLTEEILKGKAFAVIDRLANEVMQLNGMTKEASVVADRTFRPDA